ncbi:LOB domain-containing protein 22-like [Typha angustifolia]|uniref:LOB domain-containing protein 22-like n=1 Tax=Typha angustifolia TaxID=59011 RepID=UPI003C308663
MSLPPSSSSSSSSSKNNTHACAACKHQRRKCDPARCVLARYFAGERGREFRSVRRLFGVSNLMRIYNGVPPHLRDQAMRAMIFEAETRRRDPVHGCIGVIRALSAQIDAAQRELEVALRQIQLLRSSSQNLQILEPEAKEEVSRRQALVKESPTLAGEDEAN